MKPTEIGAFEAKPHLSELLEKVARGQIFRITRRGKPVAELRPIVPAEKKPISEKVAAGFRFVPVECTMRLQLRHLLFIIGTHLAGYCCAGFDRGPDHCHGRSGFQGLRSQGALVKRVSALCDRNPAILHFDDNDSDFQIYCRNGRHVIPVLMSQLT